MVVFDDVYAYLHERQRRRRRWRDVNRLICVCLYGVNNCGGRNGGSAVRICVHVTIAQLLWY